jgi:peptidoglycan/xylan/chitin deacetylase (PgdA/CDA1 family)
VTSAVREHALWALGGEDERVRRWAEEEGLATQKPPPHARSATPEELDAAAGRPGITLGSHGWSHANLAALPEDALERELVESGDWLRRRYGAAHASWLSYPYGLTTDRVIESAARTYTRALRIAGGLADRRRLGTGAHSIPRINVPSGISRAGLLLRASGL